MNYQRIYNQLILNRQNNPLPKETYTEKHHIIPKSHGGNNNKDNLVRLSAREHFVAHWLLWRIYRNAKMAYAFNSMTRDNNGRRHYNSRGFQEARKAFMIAHKDNHHGNGYPHTQEAKLKISKARKGKYFREGYSHTKETRLKMSIANKGSKNACSKLTDDMVCDIRKELANGAKGNYLATRYLVSPMTISLIKNNKRYKQ